MSGRIRSRAFLALAGAALAGAAIWWLASAGDGDPLASAAAGMVVHQSPACGCCGAWVEHMEAAGFDVRVEDRTDMLPLKRNLGVPRTVFSCHTALVGGKVVEGHVPASTLKRYLTAGAPGKGLAVPGMPAGSPGMPSARPQSYDVLVFHRGGRTRVFERR